MTGGAVTAKGRGLHFGATGRWRCCWSAPLTRWKVPMSAPRAPPSSQRDAPRGLAAQVGPSPPHLCTVPGKEGCAPGCGARASRLAAIRSGLLLTGVLGHIAEYTCWLRFQSNSSPSVPGQVLIKSVESQTHPCQPPVPPAHTRSLPPWEDKA